MWWGCVSKGKRLSSKTIGTIRGDGMYLGVDLVVRLGIVVCVL